MPMIARSVPTDAVTGYGGGTNTCGRHQTSNAADAPVGAAIMTRIVVLTAMHRRNIQEDLFQKSSAAPPGGGGGWMMYYPGIDLWRFGISDGAAASRAATVTMAPIIGTTYVMIGTADNTDVRCSIGGTTVSAACVGYTAAAGGFVSIGCRQAGPTGTGVIDTMMHCLMASDTVALAPGSFASYTAQVLADIRAGRQITPFTGCEHVWDAKDAGATWAQRAGFGATVLTFAGGEFYRTTCPAGGM